jgi:Bacterial regulatory proteins, tetR family
MSMSRRSKTSAEPRARDAERSQKDILDAARAEFAAHGLAGARVDRIAELAGVDERLIPRASRVPDAAEQREPARCAAPEAVEEDPVDALAAGADGRRRARHMLSTIFDRDLLGTKAKVERLSYMTELVLGYLVRD